MALYITQPNIKFKAYGEGNAPVLRGSNEVQDETWTDEGGGIYSLAPGYSVWWLQIDGQDAKLASTDWIDILSLPAVNQVEVDPLDLTGLDVIGAYIVCFNRPWSLSRGHLVSDYSAGTITIRRNHGYLDRAWVTAEDAILSGTDGRVKLFGLADYIKNDYDWAFESGTLYVKLPSAPSNFVIRAIKEDAAIRIKAANFEFDGIDCMDYFRAGLIVGKQADNALIQNSHLHHIREDAIRITDRNDSVRVLNNEIDNCDNRGVYLSNIENSVHSSNHIHHIGVGVNDFWLKDATDTSHYTGIGITMPSGLRIINARGVNSIEINDNYIHDTGWAAIHVFKANGKILRNRCVDTLQVMDDGGAIYLAWGLFDFPITYSVEVAFNKVSGVPEGYIGSGHKLAIYQDTASGGNHVHHNVCWDLKGHAGDGDIHASPSASYQNWHHNIVISKKGHCLDHKYDANNTIPGFAPEGVKMNNNVFISLVANKECIRIDGNVFINGGESDNNYFFQPYSAGDVAYNNLTLAQWQAVFGQDANSRSKSNWLTYVDEATAENTHVKLYVNYTDTDVEQEIPAGYEDIDGNDVGGQTLTVPAHYGLVVLKSAN